MYKELIYVVSIALYCAHQCEAVCSTGCTFPFSFKGRMFNNCTKFESERYWCNTPLGWDFCARDCPVGSVGVPGTTVCSSECVIPFAYLGVVYNGCTSVGYISPWCYTNTSWAVCNDDCPLAMMNVTTTTTTLRPTPIVTPTPRPG